MGGIIDINLSAVDVAVKRSNVSDPDMVFDKVIALARKRIKEIKQRDQS